MGQNASLRSPCFQVALPDRRITVSAEQSETLDELQREFPAEIDRIVRFYQDLRKQAERCAHSRMAAFFSRTRSAASAIDSRRFSPEFTTFLDVQARYFFGRSVRSLRLSELVSLIDSAPFTLPGGLTRLADQLLDVLLKNHGEVRYGVPLADIVLKKRGLDLQGTTLDARAILVNLPEPQGTQVCLGLQEQVLPAAMLPVVLTVPSYSRPECFFTLSLGARTEQASTRGQCSMIAWFSPGYQEQVLNERLLEVSRVVPFLKDFIMLAEDCRKQIEKLQFPMDLSLRRVYASGSGSSLLRSSQYGLYAIPDVSSTPGNELKDAERFMGLLV